MKIEIKQQKKNPLLGREEITAVVKDSPNTPSRKELISHIAALTGKNADSIVIEKIHQEYGEQQSTVTARIYDTKESRDAIEAPYKIERTEGKKQKEGEEVAAKK